MEDSSFRPDDFGVVWSGEFNFKGTVFVGQILFSPSTGRMAITSRPEMFTIFWHMLTPTTQKAIQDFIKHFNLEPLDLSEAADISPSRRGSLHLYDSEADIMPDTMLFPGEPCG